MPVWAQVADLDVLLAAGGGLGVDWRRRAQPGGEPIEVEGRMPMDALMDGCIAFGARLRMLRRSKGMSMRALTALVGLSAHSTLADYELRSTTAASRRARGM
jgi:hypothetical protein